MKRLENKIAIVTGGASGIGKATSIKFLQEGAKVIIWDVAEQKALETVKELAQDGSSIEFMKVDTTSFENVQQAAQTVADKYGRLDILVNNAGVTRDATLKNMTEEQWDLVINVNLKGVFNCAKAVMPHMVANNYGRIINAASVVALYGKIGRAHV